MAADDEDYEHWPDEFQQRAEPAMIAQGYDTHNGLREHTYLAAARTPSPPATPPAKKRKTDEEAAAERKTYTLPQYLHPGQPIYYAHPPYGYQSYGAPPAAEPKAAPVPQTAIYTYQPVHNGPAMAGTNVWLGRTKAEVDEDNQKIATKEGTYDERKVTPMGLKEDQPVWVVETDGGHTLRSSAAVKDLKGEWKQDPRYKDSWYFVCEKEKKDG